jgi:hypothetical protein
VPPSALPRPFWSPSPQLTEAARAAGSAEAIPVALAEAVAVANALEEFDDVVADDVYLLLW